MDGSLNWGVESQGQLPLCKEHAQNVLEPRRRRELFLASACRIEMLSLHSQRTRRSDRTLRGNSSMSSSASVTQWLGLLKAGDMDAAQQLWQHYFDRLVHLARARLHGARRLMAREEDV